MAQSGAAIRLLVSDVDGTLVRDDKSLSDAVVAAVELVLATGTAVSLISARPPSGMLWLAERLGLKGPMGAFNGGTIVMPDGNIVRAERLDPVVAVRAFDQIDRPEVSPWIYADGKWYARDRDNPHLAREIRAANVDPIFGADLPTLFDRVDKLVGVCDNIDLLGEIEREAKGELGGYANISRSHPYFLDITAPAANKGDGVAALAQAYGVSLAEVAALGDERNDIPMFERAALSVAMGQGPQAARAAATHVARSNEEDGVADAIERFILPAIGSSSSEELP